MSQITKTHLYVTNKKAFTEIRSIGFFTYQCYTVMQYRNETHYFCHQHHSCCE